MGTIEPQELLNNGKYVDENLDDFTKDILFTATIISGQSYFELAPIHVMSLIHSTCLRDLIFNLFQLNFSSQTL